MNTNDYQFYIAVASIVIAFLAFLISIWNGWETRRHNRLSVFPHLWFEFTSGWADEFVGICLVNNGVGPAIIKSIKYYIDDVEINPSHSLSDVLENAINKLDFNHEWVIWSTKAAGTTIPSGTKSWLIAAQSELTPIEYRNSFMTQLLRLKILVAYESIYKESRKSSISVRSLLGTKQETFVK